MRNRLAGAIALALLAAGPLAAQVQDLDTIRAGRFDTGKMWTFEYAPTAYFSDTYGFRADQAWFDRIRLSVLRIPGCSASFVSPNGLVATNHHCVRGRVPSVAKPGEHLLDDGFWAHRLEDERRIPGYYADQLIAVRDVTDRVFAATDTATSDSTRQAARTAVTAALQSELAAEFGGDAVHVEIIPLYNGGRYSAYVFHRYDDVRLVGAVELQLGFFGGDPDNFTYPRNALDFAFLRVYQDGKPLHPQQHLEWGQDGVEEGDVVFVVGNPGPTSRLNTIAQLQYTRDVLAPAIVRGFDERLTAMREYYAAHRAVGDSIDLRNTMFGLSNSLKAYQGRLEALRDEAIMARKADFERSFVDSIRASSDLRDAYGSVIDSIAALQQQRRALADRFGAFLLYGNPTYGSITLARARVARQWLDAKADGVGADSLAKIRNRLLSMGSKPAELERALLTERFRDLLDYLGRGDAVTRTALGSRSPENAADALLAESALADSARAAAALDAGTLRADDPAIRVVDAIQPAYTEYSDANSRLGSRERDLAELLGRARFAVYGTDIPPDATFSPRITDGVVKSYPHNGTIAPAYTTFFDLYDHYYSYGPDSDWNLPARWLPRPPAGLDLDTPLDFVSTADTYGGNSGSPAITPAFELVGLNFDRNIEGLSRDFIYLPERGRNVMVDSRAILEALDDVYGMDRIVAELLTGRLDVPAAEAEALRK